MPRGVPLLKLSVLGESRARFGGLLLTPNPPSAEEVGSPQGQACMGPAGKIWAK